MLESLNQQYEDFCWWQIEDERLKESLKKQMIKEVGTQSDLFLIKDNLVAVAKSERQDDVLFSDGDNYYVIHLAYSSGGDPRYKVLRQHELRDYLEWYYYNV